MSKITHTRATTSEPAQASGVTIAGTRIDAAHVLGDGPAPLPEAAAEAPTESPAIPSAATPPNVSLFASGAAIWSDDLLARLRVQGRQLAERLRERQRELDRREANSAARMAELENEIRAARLWLLDRQQELADREAQLADRASRVSAAEAYQESARHELAAESNRREEALALREQEIANATARLERQTAALADAQLELEARRQREHRELVEQRQQHDRRRQETLHGIRLALTGVERRRLAIEQQAAELAAQQRAAAAEAQKPTAEQVQRARELQMIAERLTAREAALDASERLLERAAVERDAIRLQLQEEAERLQAQAQIEQRRLADERRAADELASRQQETLRHTQVQLDQRQLALDRLRDELTVIHREALETRAAADEALARLAGPDEAAGGAVLRAMHESRQKLSEQWRIAAAQGAAERAELATIGQEISLQLEKLRAEKAKLETWSAARESSFAQQAAALVERESQVRAREAQLRDEREVWSRERAILEQRLRAASQELATWSHSADCPLREDAA